MSKRYLWVVERKDGDEWVPLDHLVSTDENKAQTVIDELRAMYVLREYRAVKYTPAPPEDL